MSSTFTSEVGTERPLGMAVDRSGDVFVSNNHSIVKFDSSGTPSTFASDWVSPDKQWEYRRVNGVSPEIVKAGTTQDVFDPSEDLDVNRPEEAEVVWAPDSKRFAFNYTAPSAAPHELTKRSRFISSAAINGRRCVHWWTSHQSVCSCAQLFKKTSCRKVL